MWKNLKPSYDRYLVNFRSSQLNRLILSPKLGGVEKKQKYIFFSKKQKSGGMEPSPRYLGRPPCSRIFVFDEKNCTFVLFDTDSTGFLLNSDWHYHNICPNSPKFGTFWLQITFILHIIPMKNIIGQFFYQKLIFWKKIDFRGSQLIFGAKIDFWGQKMLLVNFFLHEFNNFYT